MREVFLDWAHEEEKHVARINGKVVKKYSPKEGDLIFTENLPTFMGDEYVTKGAKIFKVHTGTIPIVRERLGLEKTHENDTVVLETIYHETPHLFKEWEGTPKLFHLFRKREELVKVRTSFKQRNFSANLKEDASLEHIDSAVKEIEKEIKGELKHYPIYKKYLSEIKGFGPAFAGAVVGIIDNVGIENFKHASNLRSYFGIIPDKDGLAKRNRKGEAGISNEKKALMLGRIAKNFIMNKSQYKEIYDREKARRLAMRFEEGYLHNKYNGKYYKHEATEYKLIHCDKMARRKMMQVFLDHLWVVWRQLEGLPTTSPYAMDKLKHYGYIKPYVIPTELEPFESFKA